MMGESRASILHSRLVSPYQRDMEEIFFQDVQRIETFENLLLPIMKLNHEGYHILHYLIQIETNCRQHFKVHLKRKKSAI